MTWKNKMKAQAKFTAHTNTLLCESRIDPNPKSLSWARGCVPCTDWRLCLKYRLGKSWESRLISWASHPALTAAEIGVRLWILVKTRPLNKPSTSTPGTGEKHCWRTASTVQEGDLSDPGIQGEPWHWLKDRKRCWRWKSPFYFFDHGL